MVGAKMRRKIDKIFGPAHMFNEDVKIPICDVVSASWVMGKQNQETFWETLIRCKKEREANNETLKPKSIQLELPFPKDL
jgi:hypothetical protein